MIDLSKLTIIIPTYNRSHYVIRNMTYWSKTNAIVHVLDGSDNPIENINQYNFPYNINYHHLAISFADRISFAKKFIKTEFCILLGDDDIFLCSGLHACIQELECSNDIISCLGRTIWFNYENDSIVGGLEYLEMENYKILDDDRFERMRVHMNPYRCSTIYSVVKSKYWLEAADLVSKFIFEDPGVVELQFELAISYLGKSKVIPNLMWLRSNENPSLYDGKKIKFHIWWNDPRFNLYQNKLIDITSEYLSKNDKIEFYKLKKEIYNAYSEYSKWCMETFEKNNLFIVNKLVSFFKKSKLFGILLYKISIYLKKLFFTSPKISLLEACNLIHKNKVTVDFDEIRKIDKFISDFHKSRNQFNNSIYSINKS